MEHYQPFHPGLKLLSGDRDAQRSYLGVGDSDWSSITNKPLVFPPSAHAHSAADITSGTLSDSRLSSNVLLKSGNLSGLASLATSRTNLGLGSADSVAFGAITANGHITLGSDAHSVKGFRGGVLAAQDAGGYYLADGGYANVDGPVYIGYDSAASAIYMQKPLQTTRGLVLNTTTLSSPQGFEFRSNGTLEGYAKHQATSGVMTINSGRSTGWGGSIQLQVDTATVATVSATGVAVTGNVTASSDISTTGNGIRAYSAVSRAELACGVGGWGGLQLYYGANGLSMFVAPGGAIYHNTATDLIYLNQSGSVENARLDVSGNWTTRGGITASGSIQSSNALNAVSSTRVVYIDVSGDPTIQIYKGGLGENKFVSNSGGIYHYQHAESVWSTNAGIENVRIAFNGDITARGNLACTNVTLTGTLGFSQSRFQQSSAQTLQTQVYDTSLAAWQETSQQKASPGGALYGFLGATPIGKQTHAALATDLATAITRLNQLCTHLTNFGFFN